MPGFEFVNQGELLLLLTHTYDNIVYPPLPVSWKTTWISFFSDFADNLGQTGANRKCDE